jgi:D-methionine transport system substrate-binding protein
MRIIKLSILLAGLFALVGNVMADEVITIAASPVPHAEILKQVQPLLKKSGIDLEIKEFNDYILPNMVVQEGKMDANFFQHRPYLEQFNKERNTDLVELVGVEIEPIGIYASKNPTLATFVKSKSVAKLPKNGLKVGVPNDTTNEGRALLLLQKHGFIQIRAGVKFPTKNDIVANPYNLTLIELEAPMLPRLLLSQQVDLAVVNSNFALGAGLNPVKDPIFLEDSTSPYVNIIAVRKDSLNTPKMKKLIAAIKSPQIKAYMQRKYRGAVVPAY